MDELIEIKILNEEPVVSSLQVAKDFEKRHADVIRKIERLIAEDENAKMRFYKSYYQAGKKSYPYYDMNEDTFTFLVMGFTGKKASEWKWKYIEAFNMMRKEMLTRRISVINQKASMQTLHDNLLAPDKHDYMKANVISNKAISNIFGYPKSIKKSEMTSEMLEKRDKIIQDTVELMAMKEKFNLDIHVSEKIYEKYC